MLELLRTALPELFTVTVLIAEVTLVVTFPKSSDVGTKVTAGAAATPVPLSAIVCDGTPPPKGCVSVAVREPAPVGVKVAKYVHEAFGASVGGHDPETKSAAFVPVTVVPLTAKVVFPVFCRVTS